jgi:outer membrane protein TolC
MKRILTISILIFLMLVNIESIFSQAPSNKTIMENLIEEALKNNPELKVFGENIEVFKERPPQARSLDNPRLKLSIMNLPVDTFDFDQEPMTQKQVSIMQKFPFPGKLELKGNMAEKEVNIAEEDYNEQKNALIKHVKAAYMNLLFIDRALEVTEENRKLLREFVKIAETKYEVGKGIQQDVIKSQVELSKMTDRLISFKQKRKASEALLNTFLNRPVQQPFVSTEQIILTDFNISFEGLKQIAEENRPVLHKINHLIERNQIAVRLSEKNYYPDFDIGIAYGQRDDGQIQERADFLSGFVTIKLPLWYKTKESRKIAEDKANTRRAMEEYNAMKNNIHFRIQEIVSEIEKSLEEIELFQTGLIPQSRLSLDSALSGYTVNKVDFLTLVNNQITLYNFELDYYRAVADHEIKIAELESVIGKRLFNSSRGN